MAPWTKHDWNGDGKIDKWDDLYELGMLNHLAEEQEREEAERDLEWLLCSDTEDDD